MSIKKKCIILVFLLAMHLVLTGYEHGWHVQLLDWYTKNVLMYGFPPNVRYIDAIFNPEYFDIIKYRLFVTFMVLAGIVGMTIKVISNWSDFVHDLQLIYDTVKDKLKVMNEKYFKR